MAKNKSNKEEVYVPEAVALNAEQIHLVDDVIHKIQEQMDRLDALPPEADMSFYLLASYTGGDQEVCKDCGDIHPPSAIAVSQRGLISHFLKAAKAAYSYKDPFMSAVVSEVLHESAQMMHDLRMTGNDDATVN